MFLRMVTHAIRRDVSEKSVETYNQSIMPALRTTTGCAFAAFLQNTIDLQECISLTIWNSQKESFDYEESGLYKKLVDSLRPYFTESSEFKLELSADLSLEYTPIVEEPTVKRFSESVANSENISSLKAAPFAIQVLSLTVQDDKIEEFEKIFSAEIHPKFISQKGFIDLIVVRQDREFYVLSFWDETVDIQSPSGEHSLNELLYSISKILPSFIRWRVSHKNASSMSASSEEAKSTVYRCLTAEWF